MLHRETVTNKRKFVTCDFCHKQLERHKQCPGCGKDVCPQCGHWWMSDPWTGDDNGDYPPLACERCNTLARQVAPEAIEIQQDADEKIDEIKAKWKRDCLAT